MTRQTGTTNSPDAGAGTPDEPDLVRRAQAGDREAFAVLYRTNVHSVYRFMQFHLADRTQVEDLTQEVFLAVLKGLHTFEVGRPFKPWLLQVARNRLANHWRAGLRRPQVEGWPEEEEREPEAPTDPVLGGSLEIAVDPDQVAVALDRLTELQRTVLALRFGAELSVAEVAEQMGRSENAVKNLQFKALAALRRALASDTDGRPS